MTRHTGKVVCDITVSVDGYSAGHNQTEERPFGDDGGDGTGAALHAWMFDTPDENRAELARMGSARAFVMGRNMFGPVRGPWPDESWRGWWGENPVYHVPVFVLTHHARAPLVMEGGTTFHFVTDGIDAALARAREAAGGKDVRLGGGVSVIQQYLRERLIDEMHVAISPVLLGAGERLFDGVNLPALGYACTRHERSPLATHVVFTRQ